MAPFTVVIIGGGVAGLTLANVLERYGIEYSLLEKHKEIAPQLGASIGILPYGSQILDQLGMEGHISSLCESVETMQTFGPDGECLTTEPAFGQLLADLTGYRFSFMDRQELIEALYDNLRDKSRVHVAKELHSTENLDGEVQITTKDGTTFTGDLLVGADGVHSRTRAEMWKVVESEDPTYTSKSMADSITCTYRCMFGIADCPDGFPRETGLKSYHKNRSYLCQSGREGKFYFFAFIKNGQRTVGQSIPRYTIDDEQAVVDKYREDVLCPGVTFGDIYMRRRHSVLVPLQEYVLDKCFYKRTILIGDSFHKFNPLTGQGGNSAIEDAALLGDLLKKALQKDPQPTCAAIQAGLADFQRQRQPRTDLLRHRASSLQALEALENPLLEFMTLRVIAKLSIDQTALRFAEMCSPGHALRHLPEPSRRGVVLRDHDVGAKPSQRALHATILWSIIMASPIYLAVFATACTIPGTEVGLFDHRLQLYISMCTATSNTLWTVESYRPGFFLSPIHSALPYILASNAAGWEYILPLYFIAHIYASRSQSFYYPNPRAIDTRAAKILPICLLIAYVPSIIWALMSSAGDLALHHWTVSASHFALPLTVYLGLNLSKRNFRKPNTPELLYGNGDIPHLLRTYNILTVACATFHVLTVGQLFPHFLKTDFVTTALFTGEVLQLMALSLAIIAWCSFTIWDLHRTHIIHTRPFVDIIFCCVTCLLLGPAATLARTWKRREIALEESRCKISSR